MGYYINPKDMTKEKWLTKNGRLITQNDARVHFDGLARDEYLPVCLVENGHMSAAGIAFCKEEAERFSAPDPRPKLWFLVKRELLAPFMPEDAK